MRRGSQTKMVRFKSVVPAHAHNLESKPHIETSEIYDMTMPIEASLTRRG